MVDHHTEATSTDVSATTRTADSSNSDKLLPPKILPQLIDLLPPSMQSVIASSSDHTTIEQSFRSAKGLRLKPSTLKFYSDLYTEQDPNEPSGKTTLRPLPDDPEKPLLSLIERVEMCGSFSDGDMKEATDFLDHLTSEGVHLKRVSFNSASLAQASALWKLVAHVDDAGTLSYPLLYEKQLARLLSNKQVDICLENTTNDRFLAPAAKRHCKRLAKGSHVNLICAPQVMPYFLAKESASSAFTRMSITIAHPGTSQSSSILDVEAKEKLARTIVANLTSIISEQINSLEFIDLLGKDVSEEDNMEFRQRLREEYINMMAATERHEEHRGKNHGERFDSTVSIKSSTAGFTKADV